MGQRELLDELKNLGSKSDRWFSIATICEKLKTRTADNTMPARRIRDASEVVKYSTNTLNRMVSVKGFVDSVSEKTPWLKQIDLNDVSFPSLEVVKRLYQKSPEDGIAMLNRVLKGEIKYRDLQKYYDETMTEKGGYSIGQISRRESQRFEDTALRDIQDESTLLFGKEVDNLIFETPHRTHLADVIVSLKTTDTSAQYGIIFFKLNTTKQNVFKSFIEASLTYGNFFHQYWIIFPSNCDWQIVTRYLEILKIFNKTSYGVATIPWGEDSSEMHQRGLQVIRGITGPPVPNLCGQRDKFTGILSQ